jgi:hypothetical protein
MGKKAEAFVESMRSAELSRESLNIVGFEVRNEWMTRNHMVALRDAVEVTLRL